MGSSWGAEPDLLLLSELSVLPYSLFKDSHLTQSGSDPEGILLTKTTGA